MERTASEPLLSCQGVDKYFGALAAVRDMTFDVFPGEALGIGGPNGAGKTTLFDVISGPEPGDRRQHYLRRQDHYARDTGPHLPARHGAYLSAQRRVRHADGA